MSAFVACSIQQFRCTKHCEIAKVIRLRALLTNWYLKNTFRKLILCALGMSDQAKAREVYSQMSPSNKKDPSTMYLLYKVALRCRDPGLGDSALCFSKDE